MEENPNKLSSKKIRNSSSSVSINSQNPQSKFVFLINHLSSDIKKFYTSIKQCIDSGKQNIFENNNSSINTFELIDKYLNEFILKAKEIFKRMKYMQKINLIQQEINNNQNSNQNLNINLHNQNSNNNYLKSYHDNKKLIDDDVNIPSLCNNTSTSFNINQFFKKISIEKKNKMKEKQDMIKSLNNSSKDIKLINKYDSTFSYDKSQKKNNHSANKIIYNNYDRQYINLKRNINKKSVINLRKKIIFDKKNENSSLGLSNSNGLNNINSNNISLSELYLSKKEIYDNLHVIISLLKEMKLIKGNIFTKSLEAEKHKKILKKIYKALIKLIQNIFKDSNINNNSLDIFNKDEKSKNNSNSNLIYFKTSNNINNNNNNDNNNIYYKKEIKYRDLIIQQLKEELNTKSQKIINANKEENINKNKSKKIINELQEKIDKNQKKNFNYINKDKNFEILKQKCIQLQQEKDNILFINEELQSKIILLNQELDIVKKNAIMTPIYENLFSQNFNFNYPSINNNEKSQKNLITQNFNFNYLSSNAISEKAQKIIDELTNEINNYKEQTNKSSEEIIKLNNDINKYKEEITQLNQKYNEGISEIKTLKEEIENLNNSIEKYKKLISYQEEELKNIKNEPQYNQKSDKDLLNKSLSLQDSINNNNINNINNPNNIINTDDKKNKKRNISKINEYQIEQDKIYLKYELLKNDYDKLNSTLIQKQKLLDNYSKISSETASKTNIDEQILELMAQHKKEIEALTEKYNKNILSLKMNMPSPFSPATHTILIDKRYSKYDLKWYLLTVLTEQEKNYENTFWVSDFEMRPILDQFNLFKTEKELEDEKFDNLYKMQDKWIKQLDEKEKIIENLEKKIDFYENNNEK